MEHERISDPMDQWGQELKRRYERLEGLPQSAPERASGADALRLELHDYFAELHQRRRLDDAGLARELASVDAQLDAISPARRAPTRSAVAEDAVARKLVERALRETDELPERRHRAHWGPHVWAQREATAPPAPHIPEAPVVSAGGLWEGLEFGPDADGAFAPPLLEVEETSESPFRPMAPVAVGGIADEIELD